ncbi:C4-dicarboxylate ABC transporter substrate-binding protein [Amycolatopsis antarctica]|uniref:C4-dicarboxylate ABC transporter substrate-binding protein n=1 Tax=Amycolatopsis antarctica TaxID=1854586 RepID=A0A263D2Z1_9PSEU|nr:TAXI family TRAP transporter solute-binding subunit [Amycolatopsis antarctica]OZM72820.1 C4-dicarboxylate ABC transporter substrate-binding protein [Amycolatopsis antarctica]
MRASRRTVLLGGLGFAVAACGPGTYPGPDRGLVVAAGEPGGFYVEFGQLLAAQIGAVEPDLRCEVVATAGSADNLGRVRDGSADLALVLADVASSAHAGEAPFTEPSPLRAIGRVYENYMQLVVLADSPVWTVTDLSGGRISLGADGSGAAIFGERLLAATGLVAGVDHRPLAEAITALEGGTIDALLWSGGVPTPALAALAARRPIRLVETVAQLPAMQAAHGSAYERVAVPEGGYGAARAVPTIGVPNLLVSAPWLPDEVADAIARVLVSRAPSLVPPQALGTQYLDQRSLVTTGRVPLHPGAATAYRDLRG